MKNIVDLNRYPVNKPESIGYLELVNRLQSELDRNQICIAPGFLLDPTRMSEIERMQSVMHLANPARSYRNVYLERTKTEGLADDHPRNILSEASYKMIGAHLLPEESALKILYKNDQFRQFVADVTGSETLYPSDDPYQPVNVLCHESGDNSAWHFDSSNAFTMTLMLQAPEKGGEFEIAPNIRSQDDPNIEQLKTVLLGDRSMVRSYTREEGALVIFRGCHSAHRVTMVEGAKPRLMCVMVYEDRPGVTGDPVVNETVYGIKASTA